MSKTMIDSLKKKNQETCKCCSHGHAMTPENTYEDGTCIECRRIRAAKNNEAVRERRALEARAEHFFKHFPDINDRRDIENFAAVLDAKAERLARRKSSK